MPDLHLISAEVDRRAYQVAQNIVRLHTYRQQSKRLERMKVRLANEFLKQHERHKVDHLILAINAGAFALNAGNSYEQACSFAESRLQELAQ